MLLYCKAQMIEVPLLSLSFPKDLKANKLIRFVGVVLGLRSRFYIVASFFLFSFFKESVTKILFITFMTDGG